MDVTDFLPDPHAVSCRLFLSEDRTLLVRIWKMADGSEKVEVTTRATVDGVWAPPIQLNETQP